MRLISIAAFSAGLAGAACSTAVESCTERLQMGEGKYVRIFRTFPLAAGSDAPATAVIMIHGTRRDPERYFGVTVNAARGAGLPEQTLAIAPHFQSNEGGSCRDSTGEGELSSIR